MQKLQERLATFKKATLPDKEKEKWMKVFIPQMVSSEESDDSDEDTIVIKPLGWRTERVDSMFHSLDNEIEESKTTQSRRQRKNRVISSIYSTRDPPKLPKWAVVRETYD
jgi:hypothetical protein